MDRIGKYEVTNAQYAEFLNAVAATDTNALYSTSMGSGFGRESMPVNFVSFSNSLRFANWLHNGQPTGAQGNATTEEGAYTITALGITNNSIARNPGGHDLPHER